MNLMIYIECDFSLEGGYKWVSSGRDTAIALTQNDAIYSMENVSVDDDGNLQYDMVQIQGGLMNVSVHKGVVWGVSSDNRMWRGDLETLRQHAGWTEIDNEYDIVQIEIGEFGVFGVNANREIFYRVGTHQNSGSAGTRWQVIPGHLSQISVGMNHVWGVNHANQVYTSNEVNTFNEQGEIVWVDGWLHVGQKTGTSISTL